MKISILCASRGRPERFRHMAESALYTAENPASVDVRLAVDADDPTFSQYPPAQHVQQFRTPSCHLFNALAHGTDGEILMAASDDILFRTKGWDAKVRAVAASFHDGLYIAAPMNGDGRRRVNHWFTGRQWLALFGWIVPPHFEHFCGDEWVQEVASARGRLVYMSDVLIEHMHKKYGKSENDDTYKSKREKAADGSGMTDRDVALMKTLAPQLAADRNALLMAIT